MEIPMLLNEIADNAGARKPRMRVGRGIGCTKGKTCGRGVKGQKARTGVAIKGFEGGQMPIHRRLPKRGFKNHSRVAFSVVNLVDLQAAVDAKKIDAKVAVDREVLVKAGLVRSSAEAIKLLGVGEISAKLQIIVCKASATAVAAVEKAGGKVTVAA
jgi:large subunit ribosomal protein L15